jgi:hypothetical protein
LQSAFILDWTARHRAKCAEDTCAANSNFYLLRQSG